MSYVEGTWHTQIIKAYAEAVKTERGSVRYLEIGVRYAPTFNAILQITDDAYGVDIEDVESYMHGGTFYHGSSDDFFKDYKGSAFDIVFIDGLHTYEQVEKDFYAAEALASDTIFLHDTWPALKENESACGDVWRFADKLEKEGYHLIHTFKAFPGLTVISECFPDRF